MFSHVKVTFPNTTVQPTLVYKASLHQSRYKHEVLNLTFRDWGVDYNVVAAGSPIQVELSGGLQGSRTFYGYVHHVSVDRTPGTFTTEVTALSASMVMKNQSQYIYKGLSADAIVQKIGKKYKFAVFTVPHPRIYPQVAQAGHTDWELLVRLAKQSGYSLRTQNTELYFQPVLHEYTNYREQSIVFTMRQSNDPNGSTIYSFTPVIGESMPYDNETKAAIAVGGVDKTTTSSISITNQLKNKNTKIISSPEFFDRYETSVVASSPDVAKYEAKAADDRASFPYRATVEVLGEPTLRPDMPVYFRGISDVYDGYWTILATEHKVYEKERNVQVYTTVLHVGTDSLGQAGTWTDNKTVIEPNTTPRRTIIPGVKQTVIVPKTTLLKATPIYSPQAKTAFGTVNNRSSNLPPSPVWVTTTATLDPINLTAGSTLPNVSRG